MNKWQERNEGVIEEFRANGGKVKGWAPLILLTTTGAKTGQRRIIPLMYVSDGDRVLAIASKGGSPKHPLWYHNLLAHPEVTVEVGSISPLFRVSKENATRNSCYCSRTACQLTHPMYYSLSNRA